MRYKDLIEGLQILAKTEKDGDESFGVCAEHDMIWAGGEVHVSVEDRARLIAMGWTFDSDVDRWLAFV